MGQSLNHLSGYRSSFARVSRAIREKALLLWHFERPLLGLIVAALLMVSLNQALLSPYRGWHKHGSSQQAAFRPAVPVPRAFRDWRNRFCALAAPHDPHGLVRGIFLGDASAINNDVSDLFRTAGLSHLLAASGYNCWIVAVAFGILGRLALIFVAPWSGTSVLLLGKRYTGPVTSFSGAWLFWLWTDQSPPITRCVVTISAKHLLDATRLSIPFVRLLLIQYLVSLLVLPRLWRSASFQLTFGCLFGLLILPGMLERFKPRLSNEKLRYSWSARASAGLWDYFATGLGACLGTIPTTWIVFGTANFSSLLTNWFAVPVVSFGVMPLGLALMLVTPLTQYHWALTVAELLSRGAGWSAELLLHCLQSWCSVMPSLLIYAN